MSGTEDSTAAEIVAKLGIIVHTKQPIRHFDFVPGHWAQDADALTGKCHDERVRTIPNNNIAFAELYENPGA